MTTDDLPDHDRECLAHLMDESDARNARTKHCVLAIASAGIPFDWMTASILEALGENLSALLAAEETERKTP